MDISKTISCLHGNTLSEKTWKMIKAAFGKVHTHFCGHENFTNFKLLLERNNMWNDEGQKYLTELISKCTPCRSSAPPEPSRKVCIRSISKASNEIICMDHFYLGNRFIIHLKDLVSRYSAGQIVQTTPLDEVVIAFEAI